MQRSLKAAGSRGRDHGKKTGRMRGLITMVAVMTLLALLPAGMAGAKQDELPKVDFWLTVLHNNDGESALVPTELFDEDDNFIGSQGGAAYFAAVREAAETAALMKPSDPAKKKGKRAAIFVSSGDNFLAGPEFTASLNDGVFYDAMALDMLNYTAIDLGNHDFDFGPDLLADFINDGFSSPPTYLSANLDFGGEPGLQALVDSGVISGSTIVKQKGRMIGIVGATTENLPFISSPRNVVVNLVAPAVQAEIDAMTAAGVDIIVMISHLQDVDGDVALAAELSGVDIMIAGGGDELLANPDDALLPLDSPDDVFGPYPMMSVNADGQEIPVVTTSGSYGYLGNLTVGFDKAGDVVMVDDELSRPIRVVSSDFEDGVEPVQSFVSMIQEPVELFVDGLASNVIANSEVALDGTRANVRSMETNEGNLIADSQLWQAQQLAASFGVDTPQVGIQNGGGIRNDDIRGPGDITELDTFAMAPFGNFVSIVEDISPDQFKEILENAVSRTQPGDLPGGTGRFAQIAGFTMEWSASGTAQELDPDGNVVIPGTRIREVVLDDSTVIVTGGAVAVGAPTVDIAIADFLARGGDEYPFRGASFATVGVVYQQALFNYIVGPLGGLITAADYPEGGEGRNVELP